MTTTCHLSAQQPRVTGSVEGLSATTLAQLNWVTANYGQTGSSVQAAAVQFVVKYLANPQGMLAEEGDHATTFNQAIQWEASVMGSSTNAVVSLADSILATAQTITPSAGAGSATLNFSMDMYNSSLGALTLSQMSPSTASGTVTLTNGVFSATGLSTYSGSLAEGQSWAVTGVPPAGNAAPYQISANLSATGPGSGYAGNVHLFTTSGEQTTIAAGSTVPTSITANSSDPTDVSQVFDPVISTTVGSQYYAAGATPSDTVTFSTGADTNGVNNSWYQSGGQYAVVSAQGTLYGPFTTRPTQSATVPSDAPVAETAIVSTSASAGPTTP